MRGNSRCQVSKSQSKTKRAETAQEAVRRFINNQRLTIAATSLVQLRGRTTAPP